MSQLVLFKKLKIEKQLYFYPKLLVIYYEYTLSNKKYENTHPILLRICPIYISSKSLVMDMFD